ncbi:MAG: TIGR03557 family F420-dependent LLM class oxidoreductase [Actinomycetota bacterium]|nr:TIGR03557 family F420-dependent LLM class oxidoreductase [Actinomycetota bacterium]
MTEWGYTMMCEQSGPKALVHDLVAAEAAGFDFSVISDHYFPWLDAQGHAPYAWSVLGAAAQATERIGLMTYVTCPIKRYHPAVVAQKAATVALLSDNRFTLGLGAGENLNEHVTGGGWPPVNTRHAMLREAVDIITALWAGGYVTYEGTHFHVDSARLWDLPDSPIPLGIAVSGRSSCDLAGAKADVMIGVEPQARLVELFEGAGGSGKAKVGQIPVCFDTDRDAAVARAHDQFRWFAGGWKVNAELPGTAGFAGATQFVTPADVAASIPCGSDVNEFVKAIAAFPTAGYTHVALVQVGADSQAPFIAWAERELLPALRKA